MSTRPVSGGVVSVCGFGFRMPDDFGFQDLSLCQGEIKTNFIKRGLAVGASPCGGLLVAASPMIL
jgi:hypothetical protein